jgi:Uma2 family endonuclease
MTDTDIYETKSRVGTPTWEMARFYPTQGDWSEEDYLALKPRQLIEFTDGVLEFLPMPDRIHQDLVKWLFKRLDRFVESANLGAAYFAPLRVKTDNKKYREPDVVYLTKERDRQYPDRSRPPFGADLVMEVVSEGEEARNRDLQQKPIDYATAGIPEYWIVDPENRTITVLSLDGTEYFPRGVFGEGEVAESVLLPGFSVDVSECFAQATPDLSK